MASLGGTSVPRYPSEFLGTPYAHKAAVEFWKHPQGSGSNSLKAKKNLSGPKIETGSTIVLHYGVVFCVLAWWRGVVVKGISVGHINEVTLHATQIVVSIGMGDRLCY